MTDFTYLEDIIKGSEVVLFMKGTPAAPACGFSSKVAKILQHLNVEYRSVNVLDDVHIRSDIKSFSDWPTIPQLYIRGEFVGGADIVGEMFESGELQTLLNTNDNA